MIDIKQKPSLHSLHSLHSQTAHGAGRTVDLSGLPEVSLNDVQGCLRRSGAARSLHERIQHHRANRSQISAADIEGILARAGSAERTDVKTVLAYHAHENCDCFSNDALKLLQGLDWTDVAAAHVDELKKQNADQVKGHRSFIDDDRKLFERERADRLKVKNTNDEKAKLQAKTPLQIEADFAEETTKSGLNSKEAFLLLSHRKRFANND